MGLDSAGLAIARVAIAVNTLMRIWKQILSYYDYYLG
jgi:hypothetical protein